MQVLKADTAVNVKIGPFVDVTDGFTPETGITLGAADEAELLKPGTTNTADISSNAWGAITGCDGWYWLTLTTGNLDTEGILTVVVQDDSVCLPVYAHFMVVNANVYDSLYAAAATDYLDVSLVQWLGTAPLALSSQRVQAHLGGMDDIDLSATMKTSVNAEVDTALNTAIPGSPTADSINERVKAVDDKLPSSTYLKGSADSDGGMDSNDKADVNTEVDNALNTAIPGSPTANSINERVAAVDDKLPTNYIMGSSDQTDKDDEIDAIKAKTDNLPADPADESSLEAAITAAHATTDAAIVALNDITVAEIIAGIADGSYDLQEMLRLIFAACAGKSSGGGTSTIKFRDSGDAKDRITATVDSDGNRTAVTLDAT